MEQHRVDHLLLLVGSNPVPNAVAGKLLVKPGGAITLICSEDSLEVAQRLKSWLQNDVIKVREPNDSKVDPADPHSIFKGVRKTLDGVNAQSVGLNYTGGTKAMSVHAYRAVEQWCKARSVQPKFSYLDARTLKMVFDPEDPESGQRPYKKYVGDALQIKLKQLMSFHNWKPHSQEPSQEPTFPDTANLLKALLSKEERLYQWKEWVNNFRVENLDNPAAWPICKVLTCLQQERKSSESTLSGQEMRHWIQGKWLEDVVLSTLINCSETQSLHEYLKNVETDEPKFELDVVAMRGYQLFAFSCSAKSRSKAKDEIYKHKAELKQKLFEVFIRARQLGGDEARVALVCLYEDPCGLRAEMKREVDPEERIQVFGYTHLADIEGHIQNWIRTQSTPR